MKMIIVEGPAGSGKSVMARYLAEKLNYPLVQSSLNNRSPHAQAAPFDSLSNDIGKLTKALYWMDQGNKAVVIDRCILSEQVYGYLRRGCNPKSFVAKTDQKYKSGKLVDRSRENMTELDYLVTMITKGLHNRRIPIFRPKNFLWIIYTPGVPTIEHRRWLSHPRTYAFEPYSELKLYIELARGMIGMENPFHEILWETEDDQLSVIAPVVRRWVDADPLR